MAAQEGRPTLTRSSGTFDHVLGDGRFSDRDAELEQFAMDPRRTPQPVGPAHLPDQIADLLGDRRPATAGPRPPAPERLEAASMPADHGVRIDNRDRVKNLWAQPV